MHQLWKVALFAVAALLLAACRPVAAPFAPAAAPEAAAAAEPAADGEIVVVDTLGRSVTFADAARSALWSWGAAPTW
jgi:hypothetical protein